MTSIPSRCSEASQAARMRSGARPSPGGSETFMRTFVATTTSPRREASHGASVLPGDLVRREIAHQGLTELHEVGSMHERKALMAELANAFVALPGGAGTLEELIEIYTWSQLGLHDKPMGVLNVNGYYDGLAAL